ncbi:MAG: LysR family transcriptional regulator [Acetobacteraceae bacterium]|nr:LysR family transcriptional regulator [Acetobacteraceae bacterium]
MVIARVRHFGRAAALLQISQPAVTRQIAELEASLGTRLIVRTSRRVELTVAGQALLDEAPALLEHAHALATHAGRAARGQVGQLNIGFRDSAANSFLPEVIRRFSARFPDVKLSLKELRSGSEQLVALERHEIDVGFVRPPIDHPSLRAEIILDEPLVAVLPADHPLGRRKRLRPGELAPEPFILWPRSAHPHLYDATFGPGGTLGFVPFVQHEAAGTLCVLGLVSVGLGVSLLPASVGQLARQGVQIRPLIPPAPALQLAAVRRMEDQSQALANFVSLTLEFASSQSR